MLASPAISSIVLTDPGLLCSGQPAALACNVTDGDSLQWIYDVQGTMPFLFEVINPRVERLPSSDPVIVPSDDEFTLSLLSPTTPGPHLASQISSQASLRMNGRTMRCTGVLRNGSLVTGDVILEVVSGA